MAHPVAISDSSFQSEVIDSDKPVLVDFWAEWCGPCKMIAPILEKIADEQGDALKIAKLDVDRNPQVSMKFQVMSIPTLLLFKNGQVVEKLIGYMPKERLMAKLQPHLGVASNA